MSLERIYPKFDLSVKINAEFEFITMNRVKLQLFQVYVVHKGKDSGSTYRSMKQELFILQTTKSVPKFIARWKERLVMLFLNWEK